MKELIAFHEKITALPEELKNICSFGWCGNSSKWWEAGVDEQDFGGWPEDIQADFHSLTNAIITMMGEGFFFRASAGYTGEGAKHPRFRLFNQQEWGKSSDSLRGDFVPDRSLIEQLKELSWKEQRAKAAEHRQNMDALIKFLDQLTKATKEAKFPRSLLQEIPKRFRQGSRDDITRIHVSYWDENHEEIQLSFDTVDELREVLPGAVSWGRNILYVVAWGTLLSSHFFEGLRNYGWQFAELGLSLE